jgi:RNA ligase
MTVPNIEQFYKHPYVLHQEWDDLIIFNYSHECTYDRAWDDVTLQARGIIFNKITGELVSRPWKKFFNFSEVNETSYSNLPQGPFTVTEKVDGSLGIYIRHKGQDYIATRGSFQSEQAQWGTQWFREHVKSEGMLLDYTYLFEIIYKQNKIVVDYGDFEGLVLLSCVNKETGVELPYEDVVKEAQKIGVTVVRQETGFTDINDLYTYCKGLPHTKEGFVVTFSNGLKVKMKGDQYCVIHKIVSRMTPIAFWEAWDLDTQCIPKDYLAQIPEEFRATCDDLHDMIHALHMNMSKEAMAQYEEVVAKVGTGDKKTFAITAKEQYPKLFSLIMSQYNQKPQSFWKEIHKRVRPTGNELPGYVAGADRIRRIQSE